ncbi:unnamed protein product [Rotaria sp. Silwood1]|nr:unnamed protein product [Rotaria sp. Silwood1]CAF1633847.1 unnamed protein product [Rotaria sp. Silwood1]CAF4723475.1 unnamed protein product [Rotaria sp. Silwood1]CAF4745626.1 unnamed protein product [Rotaria sp. Silwood1]
MSSSLSDVEEQTNSSNACFHLIPSKDDDEQLQCALWRFAELSNELLMTYLANVSHESALILRLSIASLVIITRYSRSPMVIARFLITNAIGKSIILEHHNQNYSTRLTIGYLVLIKNLIQLLGYSNLFDFDQLLISIQIRSIEKTPFSQALQTAYSTYQR